MQKLRKPRVRDGYATCLMCTNHARPEYYNETGIYICFSCADKVANTYHKVHSGLWLTWKNEPTNKKKKKDISSSLRKAVFERDFYRCKKCESHIDLCCDHIHPESKGGETTLDNLQTLCRSCNSKKGTQIEVIQ
jgi:5-methylcytosine-specific restriction endonuclease McrA